jgi:hypothetical protein
MLAFQIALGLQFLFVVLAEVLTVRFAISSPVLFLLSQHFFTVTSIIGTHLSTVLRAKFRSWLQSEAE